MFRLLQRSRISRATCAIAALSLAAATLVGGLGAGEGAGAAGGPSSLGVYVGYQAPNGVTSFGRTLGQQPPFAMDFLDGDSWTDLVNTAPAYMAAWKNSGDTMIWGLPMLPNAGSGASLSQGATGAYNSYFLKIAQDMVAGGEGSSIVRPGWEFNGGWFSWAANGQASSFIAYWQQIVTTMRSVPGQNFTFEWNPTAGDQGIGNLANYYPGNNYVDYIGLDLYDQSWGSYPGIASEWNTYLTEPYGLNWLASFAASQGKQITLPEWGLGEGPGNNGGAVNDPGTNVSGGDDATFINDMAQWISNHNVYNATFWDYGSSLLSTRSNPLSLAAFVSDFGGAAVSLPGSTTTTTSPPTTTTTTTTTVPPTTTSTTDETTTTTPGSPPPTTTSTTGPPPGTGPGTWTGSWSGTGSWTRGDDGWRSNWSNWSPPSGGAAFPGTSQTVSSVSIQSTPQPLAASQGAQFEAVITTNHAWRLHRTGAVWWNITGQSGSTVPCHWSNNVTSSTTVLTSCTVAPGALSADDAPYSVSVRYRGGHGVASSSATLTQTVAAASSRPQTVAAPSSRVAVQVSPAVPPDQGAVVAATVSGNPVTAGTPTGTVTFAATNSSLGSVECDGGNAIALTSGTASCTLPPWATSNGQNSVTVTYSGDSTFEGATSNAQSF
jgi:hypothetical protein